MNYSKLRALFDDEPETEAQRISGKWFPIRMSPDIATGERFNVGVGFIEDGRKKNRLHIKLLDSVRSFKCLYGPDGVENLTFLLTIVGEVLRSTQKLVSPSPQITFGDKAFASGESVDIILDRLFQSMVSISRHIDDTLEEITPGSVTNLEAREEVHNALYRIKPALAASIVRKTPLTIKTHAGLNMQLEVPLRKEKRFGTIASAHYRTEVYVSNNLNMAMRDMIVTSDHASESDDLGGIFILRAPTDERFYTEKWQRWIDEEIEKVREALFKTKIAVHEGSSIRELCQEIFVWSA
jgi:hypothetical protein